MPTGFLNKTAQLAKNVLITLALILLLPTACVGVFSFEDFVRDTRAQNFCDSIKTGMSKPEVLALVKEASHMTYYPDQVPEQALTFTIWGFMGVAGTVCAVTLQDDIESPRVCRRLQHLRGWSNEHDKSILARV